jgi:hypothetical protein
MLKASLKTISSSICFTTCLYKISLGINKTEIMKDKITAEDMIKSLGLLKPKLTLYSVVKRLRLKYRKWRVMNEIRQLDFDMQCTNMTYKQYELDYKRLSVQYDKLC